MALSASGKLQLDLFGLPGATFLADVVGGWALPADPAGTASRGSRSRGPGLVA